MKNNFLLKRLIKIGQLELWQKYSQQRRKNPKLEYLFWESTLRCNLSCRHCGSSCSPLKKNKELSTTEIKKALRSIADDFQAKKIFLAITGGEPLIRKDLIHIINFANHLGFSCGIVTNGILINNDKVRKLKESGLKSISVSLDGLEKTHEFIRGKGTFKKTIEGIKNIVKTRFPIIEIITCIYPQNIAELEKIYKLIVQLHVKRWRIFTISPIGRARDKKNLFLTPNQFKNLLNFIKDKRKNNKEMKVSFMEQGFLGIDYEKEVRGSFFVCLAGITVASILYDGSISACPSLPRKFIQGNIRKNNFKNIWENKFESFRETEWKKSGICKQCEKWKYCHGNGMHLWDFEKSEPIICEYRLLHNTYAKT